MNGRVLKVMEHGQGIENDSDENSRCVSICVGIHTNIASGDRMFAFSVKENIPSHARGFFFFFFGSPTQTVLWRNTASIYIARVSEGQLSRF